MFADDVVASEQTIRAAVAGRRLLVLGAAGSIGSAFVGQLIAYGPAHLVLVDPNENGLVEVVRDLRSRPVELPELTTHAIALGTIEFTALLRTLEVDAILSFAALKHVRSERDPFTLMRLLDTNIVAFGEAADLAIERGASSLFNVSSDKAVRPESAMGASKSWMERELWLRADRAHATSARFANVAFSAGSLLDGVLQRIAKRQPIAVPREVRRYFMSDVEAGQLCLLAAFVVGTRELVVPKRSAVGEPVLMTEIVRRALAAQGLEVELHADEDAARRSPRLGEREPKRWPCVFTPADTTGEKGEEELVAPGEDVRSGAFASVDVVRAAIPDPRILANARERLKALRRRGSWSKAELLAAIRVAVPELRHEERGRSLDERM